MEEGTTPKTKPPRGPGNKFLPGDLNPRRYAPDRSGIQKGGKHTGTRVKDAILAAFDKVGGEQFVERLARSKKERHHFIELLKKTIPVENRLTGKDGGPIELHVLAIAKVGLGKLDDKELDLLFSLFEKMGIGDFVGLTAAAAGGETIDSVATRVLEEPKPEEHAP